MHMVVEQIKDTQAIDVGSLVWERQAIDPMLPPVFQQPIRAQSWWALWSSCFHFPPQQLTHSLLYNYQLSHDSAILLEFSLVSTRPFTSPALLRIQKTPRVLVWGIHLKRKRCWLQMCAEDSEKVSHVLNYQTKMTYELCYAWPNYEHTIRELCLCNQFS